MATFPRKERKMTNSSDESLQMQTVYGSERCFFSSQCALLWVFLLHRFSTASVDDVRFDRFHISFSFILLIRAFISTGKPIASFC